MQTITLVQFLNKYWTLLVIAGLIIFIVISKNKEVPTNKSQDRIDSILQVLVTKKIDGTFVQPQPQPIIITIPQSGSNNPGLSNDLLKAFESMKDDNAKTRAYAEAIALKVYENKYQDTTVSIIVRDSVEGGKLTNQEVKWTVKPQKVKYYENIYYMKPEFVISAGMQFQTRVDTAGFSHEQIFPKLGYKGRNGWKFEGGVNILNPKEYMIGVEKDIFTKYNKVEEKKQF